MLTVRGDDSGTTPDYELPASVSLDQASAILGLPPADGLRLAGLGAYPVPVLDLGSTRRVGTAHLIRAAGLDKVREVLRTKG